MTVAIGKRCLHHEVHVIHSHRCSWAIRENCRTGFVHLYICSPNAKDIAYCFQSTERLEHMRDDVACLMRRTRHMSQKHRREHSFLFQDGLRDMLHGTPWTKPFA